MKKGLVSGPAVPARAFTVVILMQDGPQGDALMRYAIVIEKTEGNFSAYVPDLPGCVATGYSIAALSRTFATRSGFISRG